MAAIVVFCTTYALILPAITWERHLLCDTKEHTHTASCYAEVEITPEKRELTCSVAEHVHSDSCYKEVTTYVCGLDEDETHQHTADCMQTERVLTCEQSEHTHDDSCYHITPAVTQRQLVCTKPEHVHTDACYDAPPSSDSGYYCGYAEHTHDDSCYFEDGSLRCTMKEHTHTLSCQIDKTADLETATEWEHTFADVKLKDNWAQNVLAIADTQLGYTESDKNFVIDDEKTGAVRGYSRYGAWYGDPYGDWCAMFASFCIDYAGVKNFPLDSNCGTWIEALSDKDCLLYHPANSYLKDYTPRPGDLIFFDWDAEKQTETDKNAVENLTEAEKADAEAKLIEQATHDVDHVGLVYELIEATDTTPAQIKTIEGNNGNTVAYHTYDLDDVKILGYGQLPEAYERTYYGDDYTVTAKFDKDAGIPFNAVLKAEKIPHDSALYEQYYQQSIQAMLDQGYAASEEELAVSYLQFYDIGFYVDGQKIEPEGPVNIVISSKETIDPQAGESSTAIHFADNGTEILEAQISVSETGENEKSFSFAQSSFSVTGVMLAAAPTTTYEPVTSLADGDQVIIQMQNSPNNYLTNQTSNSGLILTAIQSDATVWTVEKRASDGAMLLKSGNNQYLTVGRYTAGIGNSNQAEAHYNNAGYWTLTHPGSVTGYTRYLNADSNTHATGASQTRDNDTDSRWIISKAVSGGDTPGGDTPGGDVVKPTYPAYVPTSPSKTGDTNIGSVGGTYWSDPATSQLESQFNGVPSDDGKVLTDKSVVYGKDDYGAFQNYDANTFGVTLSALGQDYQLKTVDQVKIPVDVVFILDVSGSMENNNTSEGITRTRAVVNAVNSAMTTIMDDNPANRAGIVMYSSGGSKLLDLDHYTGNSSGNYLEYSGGDIYTVNGLRNSRGRSITRTNGEVDGFTQGHGTYTQYGIALGAKLLQDNTDTTYTTTLNPGTDYERQVTVTRQPVIILLSDGDPTHCTNNYTDVLSGPAYGDGIYPSTTNNKGIQGYYTILSANYYKRMVGIHYDVPATFYTIGMGIYDGNSANKYKDMSGASSTGDCYKRAVLNPTGANISDLLSYGARTTDPNRNYSAANTWSISCQMLNQLLSSSYGQSTVTVGSTGSYSQAIGVTNTVVPVIKPNPYADNYNYANGAYFGNLDTAELQRIFGEIISGSLNVKTYGYMLYRGTSVEVTDEIGEGMEIKGTPMLRYNGAFYQLEKVVKGNTTSYICHKTATTTDGSGVNGSQRTVDLSEISIEVTTVDGKQTVRMKIPDTAVPSYTPSENNDWYYEALPVRLIYQVGLTEQAQTAVANLAPGKTLTYYTNSWGNISAGSVQTPHEDNPYYNNVTYDDGTSRTKQYKDYSNQKTENTTNTAGTSSVSKELTGTGINHRINVTLGNNGKLEFHNDAPSTTSINLYKVDMNGKKITTSPATFALYDNAELTKPIGTYETVDGELTIPDLTVGKEYWLKETKAPDGFYLLEEAQKFTVDATGKVNGISSDNAYFKWDETSGILLVYNTNGYELPQSGGSGLIPVYVCGMLLMAGALTYGYSTRRKRERRQSN